LKKKSRKKTSGTETDSPGSTKFRRKMKDKGKNSKVGGKEQKRNLKGTRIASRMKNVE